MNDLSNGLREVHSTRHCCSFKPIPAQSFYVLIPLFLVGLGVSIFIFIVVHNAFFLISLLLLSILILSFLLWNVLQWRRNRAIFIFLDSFPDSDLRYARDGQLVKITGFASCGSVSLESSYERVPRCIYTSTCLYEYRRFQLKSGNVNNGCFQWSLAYSEVVILCKRILLKPPRGGSSGKGSKSHRHQMASSCPSASPLYVVISAIADDYGIQWLVLFMWSTVDSNAGDKQRFSTDFYIADTKSGARALVKAGHSAKVTPLIGENTLINTTSKHTVLSAYLKKWLIDKNLSTESRLLRLEEGYVKEGGSVTVIGLLCKDNDTIMIIQPPELISTGCLWKKLLLPVDMDGLILRVPESNSTMA